MTGRSELLGTRGSLGRVFLYKGVAKQPDNAASVAQLGDSMPRAFFWVNASVTLPRRLQVVAPPPHLHVAAANRTPRW